MVASIHEGPRVFGIIGRSGAGKTTLIEALLPVLATRGVSVSTLKHAHAGFDLDRPGKDSARHRAAGAREVMLVGDVRWALLAEATPPGLDALIARMAPVDLVLVEGFRDLPIPKLEVWRTGLAEPPWASAGFAVLGLVGNAHPATTVPTLDPADLGAIADLVMAHAAQLLPGTNGTD